MEKKQLKVALVGYGMGGRVFHAPIIQSIPGLEISKILVNNQERAADARRTYPSAEIVGDLKSILQDDGIELVRITSYNVCYTKLLRPLSPLFLRIYVILYRLSYMSPCTVFL